MTLGSLVEQQRSKDPTLAKICYYDLEEKVEPGNPGAFSLKRRMQVNFRPLAQKATEQPSEGAKLQQGTIAATVPTTTWLDRPLLKITWCVKWSAKGVQPQAPRVLLAKPVAIPPAHSLVLSG